MTTLSPEQLKAREGKLTASAVKCLMTGDEDAIRDLWRKLVGDPTFEREDLSKRWPVQLGAVTEQLNLNWYGFKHNPVIRRGEVITHPTEGWAACTLDGWDEDLRCPIECKHVGGREMLSTIIDRYQPQMQWQMIVTQAHQCALSVIEGANEPTVDIIPRDIEYMDILWDRAQRFMECVWSLTPPVPEKEAQAPIVPTRTVDMTGNNHWSSLATDWLETKGAAATAKASEIEIKKLMPEDALRAEGHGVVITRDRAGRKALRELAT